MSDNWFRILHDYKYIAEAGYVKPLACPDCDNPYSIHVKWNEDREIDDIPRLHCYFCNSTVIPGLSVLSDARAVVKEHTSD